MPSHSSSHLTTSCHGLPRTLLTALTPSGPGLPPYPPYPPYCPHPFRPWTAPIPPVPSLLPSPLQALDFFSVPYYNRKDVSAGANNNMGLLQYLLAMAEEEEAQATR